MFLIFSTSAAADTNSLMTTTGDVNHYSASIMETISDSFSAGTVLEDVGAWNAGTFSGYVDCKKGNSYKGLYFTTTTSMPLGDTVNGQQFYKLPNTDSIQVGVDVFIGGGIGAFKAMPFTSLFAAGPGSCGTTLQGHDAGSKGKIKLYIKKSLAGHVIINSTTIYSISGATEGGLIVKPFADLTLNMDIALPENCTISAGQVGTIDLGSITVRSNGEKGTGALVPVDLEYSCSGGEFNDGVVPIKITALPMIPGTRTDKFGTSNKAIDINLYDKDGESIVPRTPFKLNNLQNNGVWHIKAQQALADGFNAGNIDYGPWHSSIIFEAGFD